MQMRKDTDKLHSGIWFYFWKEPLARALQHTNFLFILKYHFRIFISRHLSSESHQEWILGHPQSRWLVSFKIIVTTDHIAEAGICPNALYLYFCLYPEANTTQSHEAGSKELITWITTFASCFKGHQTQDLLEWLIQRAPRAEAAMIRDMTRRKGNRDL